MLEEPFGWTVVCKENKSVGWTLHKVLFWKPFCEWSTIQNFAFWEMSHRDISSECIVCRNWEVFVKMLGEFDQCLVVYHKYDNNEHEKVVDLIYIMTNLGVCC